jgi:hypothetical protein
MPRIRPDIEYLRDKAIQLRRLAKEHAEAGSQLIAAKLVEVAADLEAKVAEAEQGDAKIQLLRQAPLE